MNKVRFLAKNFEEILSGTLMVLMFLATFANVVARYFFNSPIQWAEEFSRYAFIWVVFLGAVVCTKQKRHISIDSLVKVLPSAVQPWVNFTADLLTLALMVIIVWYGWVLTRSATQITATLGVPQYVIYVVVPASGVLGFLYSLGDLRRHLGEALMKRRVTQ
jgi:TRAP-type C4-dicarboxylate transport system permease small subunit